MKRTAILALLATAITAAGQTVPPIWYTVEGDRQQAQELPAQNFVQGAGVSLRYRIHSGGRNWDLTGLGARWEARSNATSTAAIQAVGTVVTNVTPNYFQITLDSNQTGSAVTNWPYAFVVTLGGVDYALGTGTLNIPASAWTGASAIMTNITAASYTDAAVATHAGIIASAGALGHVRIGARLSIDVDGILSADEQAGGGGNIEQIIEGSGITITGGGGPTTTVAIATATLEAIDSAVQDDNAAFLAALTNITAGAGISISGTGRTREIASTITQYTDFDALAAVAADGYLKPNLAGGISLTGDVEAGSFTLDDVTITEWPAGGGTTDTNALDLAGERPMTGDSVTLARDVRSRDAFSVGTNAVAFGSDTQAGNYGAAFGLETEALEFGAAFGSITIARRFGAAFGHQSQTEEYGVAGGLKTLAFDYGAAFGELTQAGEHGAAFGELTQAGEHGAAFGFGTTAGTYGFAAGRRGEGGPGSFVFADSTDAEFTRTNYPNSFSVRTSGGTYFETPEFEVSGTNKAAAFSLDGVVITEWPEGGGGTTDHDALDNLAITASGHTGTASRIWGTTDAGAADEIEVGSGLDLTAGVLTSEYLSPSRTPEAITIAPTTTVTRTTAYRKLDVTEEITLLTWHADYSTNQTHLVEMSWRTGGYAITPDYDTISSNSWAAATAALTAASNAYLTVYWHKPLGGSLWYVTPASQP